MLFFTLITFNVKITMFGHVRLNFDINGKAELSILRKVEFVFFF